MQGGPGHGADEILREVPMQATLGMDQGACWEGDIKRIYSQVLARG